MPTDQVTDNVPRYLVAALGTNPHLSEAAYRLGDQICSTRFAPVALAKLAGLGGARALLLVTDRAHAQWYDVCAAELEDVGLATEAVSIPDGRDENEILEIVQRLIDRIPAGAEITLDVTFALRHLPFVYLAAASYLVGLRGVRVSGIYYGAFEMRGEDGSAPILDITSLLELLEWYHALQTVRETGSLRELAAKLSGEVSRLFQRGVRDNALGNARNVLPRLADALAAGAPVDVGLHGARFQQAIAALADSTGGHPAGRLALASLGEHLENWAIADPPRHKRDVQLTAGELARQLRLARWYLDHGDLPKVLLLLREWLVSFLLLQRDQPQGWLDYGRRKPAESYLNALAERGRHDLLAPEERLLARPWSWLTANRNPIAHAGMAEQELALARDVRPYLEACEGLLAAPPTGAASHTGVGTLLVSPLGLSPGVIYSAVRLVGPDRLLVITSGDAAELLPEALAAAGSPGTPYRSVPLADPHAGFDEARGILDAGGRAELLSAAGVVVNVTGGTTAMQHVAERLADEARRLGVPTRRLALVDRRGAAAQREAPYEMGEAVWLEREPQPVGAP